MTLQKIAAYQYPPREIEQHERAYECWCCKDTGLVQLPEEIRDEEGDCMSQMLPPMECKNCKALYRRLLDSEIFDKEQDEKRPPYPHEVTKAIRERYDTRATPEQCRQLHNLALADARTIGKSASRRVEEEIADLSSELEF